MTCHRRFVSLNNRRNNLLSLAIVVSLLVGNWSEAASLRAAERVASKGKGFLVVPVQTELQRSYFRDFRNVTAFVFVNAMDPVKENATVLDRQEIDFDGLASVLASMASDDPSGGIVFAVRARSKPRVQPASGKIVETLLELGQEAGLEYCELDFMRYDESGPAGSKYHDNWRLLVADLEKPVTPNMIRHERDAGDERVRVFATSTPLSRILYGGGYGDPADCVLFVSMPLEKIDPGMAVASVQNSLQGLHLTNRRQLLIHTFKENPRSKEARSVDMLSEPGWKNVLGFREVKVTHWNLPPVQASRQTNANP